MGGALSIGGTWRQFSSRCQLAWKPLAAPPSTTALWALRMAGPLGWGEGWPQGGASVQGLGAGWAIPGDQAAQQP